VLITTVRQNRDGVDELGMANEEQFAILKHGVDAWNAWRAEQADKEIDLSEANLIRANLSGANLSRAYLFEADLTAANLARANLTRANLGGANLARADLNRAHLDQADLSEAYLFAANFDQADLSGVDLSQANLTRANLGGARLVRADLRQADLSQTDFTGANLSRAHLGAAYLFAANLGQANLSGADLGGAYLSQANLTKADLGMTNLRAADLNEADLRGANLGRANLDRAALVQSRLEGADLTNCRIYGIAAWDLKLDETTKQADLIITPDDQPTITVDNLEVAQFVYLLLNNQRIRHVIDTIISKVVLILGRFTDERKAVLDALRDELRRRDYLPVLFDFDKPTSRDLTETIQTLAGMARFVIADLTDAKSIPQELSVIVPNLPSVPVQPLLLVGTREYGMFEHWLRFPWVLPEYRYERTEELLLALADHVIAPAEAKVAELRGQAPPTT
jgi:uncharacterized protein YjbI with pentapeptide repeats